MNEKGEKIRQYVDDIAEQIGEEDALLIVAHTSKQSAVVSALKGTGLDIVSALSFAMMENPDLLRMAKMAIGFVEYKARNNKN